MVGLQSAPVVSVVVPVHNAEHGIRELLAALKAQTLSPEQIELVVVDDASSDSTAAVVEGTDVATLTRCRERGGSYAARNRALERTTAPVIAFTDADCRPHPGWLAAGLRELDALDADLVAGAVRMTLGPRPGLAELIDFARGLDQELLVQWGYAATANLFVRRSVIDTIGTFNAMLISGGDKEFTRRAVAAGFALCYSPRAVVDHQVRTGPRAVARKSFRIGYGLGQLARHGTGPAADEERMWTKPRSYRPRHGLRGIENVRAAGYWPSGPRLAMLDVAQHVLCQLPMIAGELTATLLRGRKPG